MRTTTGGELTTLAGATRTVTIRVKVANGSGTMIDYSSWVESVSIDHDVDQPVGGCTISLTRAKDPLQSFAPLRTDSTLNVNDVPAYSPALDLNRSVTVEVATNPVGTVPVAGDYKLMFKGTVDVVNFERSPVSIICRDLGAPLVDRWIEAEATYGSGGGTAIQTVMQSILDDVFGAVYTLYVPVSPGFNIITYRQQRMSVMDALQDLVQLIGWDVRFKWDDGTSAFRLTLSEPPRTKTTPDYTFAPSTYFDITKANLDITNIRNAITGSYRNSANLGNRATVTVTDGPSITKYNRRFFLIQEADVSPIDTSAEMTTLITAALADLKDPKAEYEIDSPFHWPMDLSDLNRYPDNLVHHNTNQDWAVVEYTHDLAPNHHRTRAMVRGSPIGQYATWLGRGGTIGGGGAGGAAFPPYPFIVPLNTEGSDATWDLRFNALNGSGGGGTNLTYTIKSKETFGTETTLVSGNASAFPDDVTITRDPKNDQVITFTVTDAATGLFAADKFTVPAFVPAITGAGNVNADLVATGSTHRAVPLAELPVGTQAKTMIVSSAAFYPESDATDYTSGPDGIEVDTGSGTFIAFAPLPQGVTITKLEMWSKNPTGGGSSDVTCRLYRQSASAFGSATQIAIATRTAVASDSGGMDASSTVAETVTTNTYCLQLFLGDSLDLFLNAIVYYTMPSYDKSI